MSEDRNWAFGISVVALVLAVAALGTPSRGEKKVIEAREVTVSPGNGYEVPPSMEDLKSQVWFENKSKLGIACTENVGIAKVNLYGETHYVTYPKTSDESGSCTYYDRVSKTYVEIYGLERVLPKYVTPVFSISWNTGGDA
ncbi:hypothetical protein [Halorarum halobium]|uniref:hypothetical protein n=1 Tax=Halorarum halobium TaxID=3075121 RepID=UPI0028AC934C|nr:hypothetical protein [Halobaculum sp. XH14]